MPLPTIDGELYSEAGFVWSDPTDKYPLGRWVAPEGAKEPGIAAVGAPAYCEHPSTEILTVSYDLLDRRGIRRWRPGQTLPWDLMNHLQDPAAPIEAHNAMFERLWIEKIAGPQHGWPVPDATKWRCSMATALVAQRPAALGPLADVLGLEDQKDKEGKRLIKKFCIPQQPIPGLVDRKTGRVKREDVPARRIFPHDDPEDFENLCLYCDRDVIAELSAMAALPPMEAHEVVAWQMTQAMNYRGLGVDREGLETCINMLGLVLDRYGQECEEITGFRVTQLEKLKGWLAAFGVHANSLDADALAALLARDDLPPVARRVLELRERTGSASVKKTFAIRNRLSSDGRLRDIMIHHGTRPGRPTGEGPQPLNLPKAGPKLTRCPGCNKPAKHAPNCPWCGAVKPAAANKTWASDMVDPVLEVMSCGSLDLTEHFFGDAMTAIQGCVRGLFEAQEGHDLVSTDYSSLQAVVAACLAGEQWRIEAFQRGDPIYLLGASKITGKPVQFYLDWFAEHGDHHPDRQKIGKVSELACFSPETQVLTERGYVAIVDVLLTDRLWDGVEWVTHLGLIAKGERSVVNLDGVRMTPDHKILCGTSWRGAAQLVSNEKTLCQALATGSENLPWSTGNLTRFGSAARAVRKIASRFRTYAAASPLGATLAHERRRAQREKTTGVMPLFAPTTTIVGASLIESLPVSHAADRAIRRRARGITQGGEFAYITHGLSDTKGAARFSNICSLLKDGIGRLWNWTVFGLMGITNRATFGSFQNPRMPETNGQFATSKPLSISMSPVYDIAHAGPRNRFTIKTNSGHLIVHNCGFQGWINSYRAFGSEEPDEVIKKQILAWRDASPMIVEAWGGQWRGPPWRRERHELFGLEGMFIAAVQNPGESFDYRGVSFCMEEPNCLVVRLPQIDGIRRPLRYVDPILTPSARNPDELSISYMTWNTNPNYGARGWVRMPTWGGRLFENAVMGVEVDIQRFGAKLMEAHGYPLVLSVYDENVAEIPHGKPLTLGLSPVEGLDPYVQEVEHLLGIMPPEISWWPIKASGGWRGRRYRKA